MEKVPRRAIMNTARFLTLKPSRPDVQKARNETIRQTKAYRAEKRLRRLKSHKPAAIENLAAAEVKPVDRAGFSRWFAGLAQGRLLVGLPEHEAEGVRDVAWGAYHGLLADPRLWPKTLHALSDRLRAIPSHDQSRSNGSRYASVG